ncbi:SURF1 family protein [Aliikangiella sp. IMCC44653]
MKHTIEYNVGRYQVRINVWFLIIFLLLQTLLNELGFWQLNRAKEKQHRLAQLELGGKQPKTETGTLTKAEIERFQLLELKSEWAANPLIFLDNKVHQKTPGYHVLQLVQDTSTSLNQEERWILVNRGWVFAGVDRNLLPETNAMTGLSVLQGRVYPLPKLANSTRIAEIEEFDGSYRLPVLDLAVKEVLEDKLQVKIEDYILRLNEDSQGALLTNWVWTNMPAEKHLAYAIQWFALALAFLIISFIASIKKR